MNMSTVVVSLPTKGKKCDGTQYTKHFQSAFNKLGECATENEAVAKFWKNYDVESVGFETGSFGRAKYSAPFLTSIRQAFASEGKKTK